MRIYDISVPVATGMVTYPGDPPVTVEPHTSIRQGDLANVSRLALGSHCGTHVDAPRHFLDDGETVDRLPLDVLVGAALVVHLEGVTEISRELLASLDLEGVTRLLFKTDNSRLWEEPDFVEGYVYITEAGARYLVERGVVLVGIDYLSVEGFHGSGNVHRIFLENGVVVLEGITLEGVPAGFYELICLPLMIARGDGAPARAVLRTMGKPGHGGDFDPHTSRWPLA